MRKQERTTRHATKNVILLFLVLFLFLLTTQTPVQAAARDTTSHCENQVELPFDHPDPRTPLDPDNATWYCMAKWPTLLQDISANNPVTHIRAAYDIEVSYDTFLDPGYELNNHLTAGESQDVPWGETITTIFPCFQPLATCGGLDLSSEASRVEAPANS